jgi:hypothetical protein
MKTSAVLASKKNGINMTNEVKTIVIHINDVPSVKEITDTISRLKKDYGLLSRCKGTKDIEDPESFKQVIAFLESFLKKSKRKLSKDPSELKHIFKITMEMVAQFAEDEPELAKSTMEEINLVERITKIKGKN